MKYCAGFVYSLGHVEYLYFLPDFVVIVEELKLPENVGFFKSYN